MLLSPTGEQGLFFSMPELPEVETVRRGLAPVLVGNTIERVVVRCEKLRFPLPDDMGQRLTGKTVSKIDRRGKYLLLYISGGDVLVCHLGMSGSFRIYKDSMPDPAKHDHVLLMMASETAVHYHDPRRFGFMLLTDEAGLENFPMLDKMGPEPVDPGLTGPQLAARLKGRNTSIKAALLDQKVIAGIGNIYACEALFRSGISPKRKAATVKGVRAERLAAAINDVLTAAIDAGGSSISDHQQPNGELGYFQFGFKVYDREGKPCDNVSGHSIKRMVQNGRSTFYCPACQR